MVFIGNCPLDVVCHGGFVFAKKVISHIEGRGPGSRARLKCHLQFEAVDEHARGEIGNRHRAHVVEKPLPFPACFWRDHILKLAFAEVISRDEGSANGTRRQQFCRGGADAQFIGGGSQSLRESSGQEGFCQATGVGAATAAIAGGRLPRDSAAAIR